MPLQPWERRIQRPLVGPDLVDRIAHGSDLVQHFGHWPTFEDAELISLHFHRGNHLEVAARAEWENRTPDSLEATFYVFSAEVHPDSAERRPAHVSLVFSDLHDVHIAGLSYQNPIRGLGIHMEHFEPLNSQCFRVNWGGTGMRHEVSLLCGSIAVRSVQSIQSSP
jgi:hypothetical protein